jgi:hypothetical protein
LKVKIDFDDLYGKFILFIAFVHKFLFEDKYFSNQWKMLITKYDFFRIKAIMKDANHKKDDFIELQRNK